MEQVHTQLSTVEFICLESDTRITSTRGSASYPSYKHSQHWDYPVCRVQPDNLAYLTYTSGSTGQPKGVQIPHYAVCNFLAAMKEQPGLEAWDTLLAVTPLSFDIAGLELFWPLVTGARTVIASRETAMDGQKLASILDEQSATIMQTTPSIWRILLDAHWQPTRPMCVLCGGEAFPPDLARQLLDLGVAVWNLYGPTETTIWSTICPITVGTWTGASPVRVPVDAPLPIGHPIANTQIYPLDKYLQPVPIGVIGELYIGGIGLARGYWRRPELTAERFVANPFVEPTSVVGERLYRTGDLARYRADGTIEVLGRIDQQVKLRGLRIELGEIEATLRSHPAVQDAVVALREENETRKYLIAYVVTRDLVGTGSAQGTGRGQAPSVPTAPVRAVTPTILQGYLRERLPDYMVPTNIVFLETLPLSPNGKVDRKALPAPNWSGWPECTETAPGKRPLALPQTPVQEQLALIWAELLHLSQIGIRHNFFELGGHSLLAVELLNRINKQFDPWYKTHGLQALSLTTLFQAPTIEQLAALLEKPMGSEGPHISVAQGITVTTCLPIQPFGEKRPFFCVHPAPGVIFCFLDLAKHLRHDRPFYGIQAPGLYVDADGEQPPARASNCKGAPTAPQVFSSIEDMATAYIDALLAIQPEGPYFLGGYSFGGLVAFEMARQLEARGGSIALLALLDSYPSEQKVSAPREADTELLVNMVELLSHYRSTKIAVSYEDLCHLQPDEQLAYVLERLRKEKVILNDMDLSQLRRHLQVYEAHISCLRGYRPKPYAGRITLLRSEDAKPDPSLWAVLSAKPLEVHTVAGDHLSMIVEPHVQSLAAQLQECLDKAEGRNF